MKKLEDIANHEVTLKTLKYVGYSIEVGGAFGLVYGLITGDKHTAVSGAGVAYFGTLVHRTFKYAQSYDKKGNSENKYK
jgi:hypothetical protein